MFLGQYKVAFTGRGRIVLPKKIRLGISGDRLVLSRGFEGSVWGFDQKEWEKQAKKQLETPITEEQGRVLRRYLFSASEFVEMDKQGRIVIPSNLLEFGNLKENVTIIGAGDHFEIWNQSKWEEYIRRVEKDFR